jgi:hypothetical protein
MDIAFWWLHNSQFPLSGDSRLFSRVEVSNSKDNIKCCIIDYFFISQYGVKVDYHREVRLVILIVYLDGK